MRRTKASPDIIPRSVLKLLLVIACIAAGTRAEAQVYKIKGKFLCPHYIRSDGEWDFNFQHGNRRFLPCDGMHVVALQPGTFGNSYCGEDYTAHDGSIGIRASTECSGDVYLVAEASSLQGFHVGTHTFPWARTLAKDILLAYLAATLTGDPQAVTPLPDDAYDFLVDNDVFTWASPTKSVNVGTGDTVDFGTFELGITPDSRDDRAGKAFWMTGLALRIIEYSGYIPSNPAIVVDHPIFGTPTTIWDTILFKDSDAGDPNKSRNMFRSIPHELGHATYNPYHSGQAHWLQDATKYIANHCLCEPLGTLRFSWYEGFADFVESYVYAYALQNSGGLKATEALDAAGDPYYHVFRGCYSDDAHEGDPCSPIDRACTTASVGLNHEGNVQALLDQIYFGEYNAAYPSTHDKLSYAPETSGTIARDPHRVGKNALTAISVSDGTLRPFALPAIGDVFGWVAAAGTNSHTAREFLDSQITPWCQTPARIAEVDRRYCSTATYQNELTFLDTQSTAPAPCNTPIGPQAETSGTPLRTDVRLGFVDDRGNPLSRVDFGQLPSGRTATMTVNLMNLGSDSATVNSVLIEDVPIGSFHIQNMPVVPFQLGPRSRLPVTVALTVGAAPDYEAFLSAESTVLFGLSLPGAVAQTELKGALRAPTGSNCDGQGRGMSAGLACSGVSVCTLAHPGLRGVYGVVIASNGDVLAADGAAQKIWRITPSGAMSLYAMAPANVRGIAMDGAGKLYVSTNDCTIFTIDTAGTISPFAGSACGLMDGPVASAQFKQLRSLSVNAAGTTVYVADPLNNRIRSISGGTVGTVPVMSSSSILSVAVSGTNLYYTDGHSLWRYDLTNTTSTRLVTPTGASQNASVVAVGASGELLFVASASNTINRYTPSTTQVDLLAGSSTDPVTYADGAGCDARFSQILGLAVSEKRLVISDIDRVRQMMLP